MNSAQAKDALFDKLRNSALYKKFQELQKLERLESTIELVKTLPDKISHTVMVPMGSLAFMEGTLIHTNEFMSSIGDNYFVWKSAKGTLELLERKKEYLKEAISICDEDIRNVESLREYALGLNGQKKESPDPEEDEVKEIIEFIPADGGDPVLVQGPTPINPKTASNTKIPSVTPIVQKNPSPSSILERSKDLDNSFIEERGKGVIEENEVLVRGEWKRPVEEKGRKEEAGDKENGAAEKGEEIHSCNFCGKKNVSKMCSRCKSVWYCSRRCQKEDWLQHKQQCKKVEEMTLAKKCDIPGETKQVTPEVKEKKEEVRNKDNRVVEKVVSSIKPVVVERVFSKGANRQKVAEGEKKPKRRSLFRQRFEEERM